MDTVDMNITSRGASQRLERVAALCRLGTPHLHSAVGAGTKIKLIIIYNIRRKNFITHSIVMCNCIEMKYVYSAYLIIW